VSASVSASTDSSVAGSILSNAVLIGANTVNGPPVFSVSTSPASSTAATSVDSSGLLLAAVATGSSAMPLTLPSPSVGTAAHAAPDGPAPPVGSVPIVSVPIASVPIGSVDGGSVVASAAPAAANVAIAATATTLRRRNDFQFMSLISSCHGLGRAATGSSDRMLGG
jgi:hypothetical protein